MIDLDGKPTTHNTFSGPIGKIIDKVTSFKIKDTIPKLDVDIDLIVLKPEIVKSLSQDQKYLYDITSAIK